MRIGTAKKDERMRASSWLTLLVALTLCACAATRVAQTKTVESAGQKFDLGGTWDPGGELILTLNGDPVLRGRFAPYVPLLYLTGTYKNQSVSANCYFGSILSSQGGATGAIAGSIQGAIGKGADKCDVTVGSASEALFF